MMELPKDIQVYLEAIDRLAYNNVPYWMDPVEKKAYALGIVKDEDIVTCGVCGGTTWIFKEEDGSTLACRCIGAKGKMISLEAKRLIAELFPEYEFGLPEYLYPQDEDTPDRLMTKARIRHEVLEARRQGFYEQAEHLMSEVID